MKTRTSKECKDFLVNFFCKYPQRIVYIYDGDIEFTNKLNENRAKPVLWKRVEKLKPDIDSFSWAVEESSGLVSLDPEGIVLDINGEEVKIFLSEIRSIRVFALDPNTYEDGVKFSVIEDKKGNLLLGGYVGD